VDEKNRIETDWFINGIDIITFDALLDIAVMLLYVNRDYRPSFPSVHIVDSSLKDRIWHQAIFHVTVSWKFGYHWGGVVQSNCGQKIIIDSL